MAQMKIQLGEESVTIHVVSSNIRYVDVIVNEDLSVDMKVPIGMSRHMIEKYIELNKDAILREYEKKKNRNHQALPITMDLEDGRIVYQSGLMLPFLGHMDLELRIQFVPKGEDTNLYLSKNEDGSRRLTIRTDNHDPRFLRYCVVRYYRKCAARIVRKKVGEFSRQMNLSVHQIQITGQPSRTLLGISGFTYNKIEIQDQKTLWGSCDRKKDLKFDWKLAMLPMEIIDYIIVHELAHLKKMKHSKAFWAEIEKRMPEYKECRNWLCKHGKEYEIF